MFQFILFKTSQEIYTSLCYVENPVC